MHFLYSVLPEQQGSLDKLEGKSSRMDLELAVVGPVVLQDSEFVGPRMNTVEGNLPMSDQIVDETNRFSEWLVRLVWRFGEPEQRRHERQRFFRRWIARPVGLDEHCYGSIEHQLLKTKFELVSDLGDLKNLYAKQLLADDVGQMEWMLCPNGE